ncbi:MAG: DUF4062 domain-containing protein [Sneathiella sp.]
MNKKYQVFISSTYDDLVEERKGVEQSIIRAGDIPVGMEAFPAADEEQFEFIKSVIDQCDYYILIVAGRYGSIAEDGLSYTEKEFRYAVEQKIPVLFMLRAEIDKLPADKTARDGKTRKKLNDFIDLVSKDRIRKTWSTIDGLKLLTRESLDHSKATKPRPGWVRGDLAATPELLKQITELTAERDKLVRDSKSVSPVQLPPNYRLEKEFDLGVTGYRIVDEGYGEAFVDCQTILTVSARDLFGFVAPNMRGPLIHNEVNRRMAIFALGGKEATITNSKSVTIENSDFHDVLLHWEALGLIKTKREKTAKDNNADFSELTDDGTKLMLAIRLSLPNKEDA